MQESAELKELYRKLCDAQTNGDHEFFLRRFSGKDGLLAIGTDPDEWWLGYDAVTEVFTAQLKEVSGFQVVADDPLAFQEGSMGWVAGRPVLKLPDGTELQIRLTVVFEKEPDGWKIVLWHSSIGVDNEEVIGKTLTT